MNSKNKNIIEDIDELILTLVYLDDAKNMDAFVSDLLTDKELETLAMRWKAIRMLYVGIPYVKITKATGISSATIARLSKKLNIRNNGLKQVLVNMR